MMIHHSKVKSHKLSLILSEIICLQKRGEKPRSYIFSLHASKELLLKLTPDAELKDELFQKEIENLCDECGVCEK